MKEIFFNTYSKKVEKANHLKKMIDNSFSLNLIEKHLADKKILIWIEKAPRKMYKTTSGFYGSSNPLFVLSNSEALIVDKDKEFVFANNIDIKNYKYHNKNYHNQTIQYTSFEIKRDNVVDVLKTWSQDASNYAQIEMNIDFLKSLWNFSQRDLTLNALDFLNLIATDEQVKVYNDLSPEVKDDVSIYILGFLGAIELDYDQKIKKGNLIHKLFLNMNTYCDYSNNSTIGEGIIDEVHNFNRLMFSMFIDQYRGDELLKLLPYYINWDYGDTKNVGSLYSIFNDEIGKRDFSEKEKEKMIKKIFTLHPQMLREVNGVDNYFLTMKDFDKKYFLKKLNDFFKTRLKAENKQSNMILFETLLDDEEIQENKELFENIFPIFYQEEISFKNFIEIKEKEIKYAEFKIQELMELFPLNNSNEQVLQQYSNFVFKILANYDVDVFINNKTEIIKEKKKDREVVSLMQLYLSGNNLDFVSNEFIQKMLRMIHDTIQNSFYYGDKLDNMARELYLKLNLSDKDSGVKSKGKI